VKIGEWEENKGGEMAKIIDLSIQISEDLPRWKVEVN